MSFFAIKERYSDALLNHETQISEVIARFESMLELCKPRCLDMSKPELTRGENLCIDRCSKKFFKVVEYIHELHTERMEQEKARFSGNSDASKPETSSTTTPDPAP
jgi:hypothetical protein